MSFIVAFILKTKVWLTQNLPEMYGLCWALKTVPWSEIFLEEVIVLYYQVLHLTHGFVHVFLCTKWKCMFFFKKVQFLKRQKKTYICFSRSFSDSFIRLFENLFIYC